MKGLLAKSVIYIFCMLLGFPGCLMSDYPSCFRFTWMGPSYDKDSATSLNSSTTCTDIYDSCTDPMVVTDDGTPPDFEKLWENFSSTPEKISCRLTNGFVCAKWTSYYEDTVEYTMHTCSKITVEGEAAMMSGCVTSVTNNSRKTEVCACKTYGDRPCNSGQYPYTPITVFGLVIIFLFVLKCVM